MVRRTGLIATRRAHQAIHLKINTEVNDVFYQRIVGFFACTQKTMVGTIDYCDGDFGRVADRGTGVGYRTIRLYVVLNDVYPRDLCVLS